MLGFPSTPPPPLLFPPEMPTDAEEQESSGTNSGDYGTSFPVGSGPAPLRPRGSQGPPGCCVRDRTHGVATASGAGGSPWGCAGDRSPVLEGLGRGTWGGQGAPSPAQPPRPLAGEEYRPLIPSRETSLRILTAALSPLDYLKWRRKPWYWRLFKVLKVSRGGDTSQEEPPPCIGHPPRCWPLGLCHPSALQWGRWSKGRRVRGQVMGRFLGCPVLGGVPAYGCFSPGARGAGAAAHRSCRGPRQG